MDEIQEIVREIVQQCATRGVTVSEVLAAFVARTAIENSEATNNTGGRRQPVFKLDEALTAEAISDLIDRSVDRLLEADSPSLETLKMQVAFDSSYITEEEDLDSSHQRRGARLREMQRAIVMTKPRDGADFDALTALHRQIFNYLMRFTHEGSEVSRGVEREVAAALESVFPRISLKAFINLTAEEKYAQLEELANIVLGICLFNKQIGKGGAHLPNVEAEAVSFLRQLGGTLSRDVESMQHTCLEYQDTIVHIHLRQPQGVTPAMLSRWKDELANRRQYMSYLQSVQEDLAVSERKVASLREKMATELADLQELVGNRASVPKEHVYPKFYDIATHWMAMYRELKLIRGRGRTLFLLESFHSSYTPSLTEVLDTMNASAQTNAPSLEEEVQAAQAAVAATMPEAQTAAAEAKSPSGEVPLGGGDLSGAGRGTVVAPPEEGSAPDLGGAGGGGAERPVKLSIESTPEFMQLPLEYQGFCPWTIVNRQGLLLPGKPELGVARYKNCYYVFAHQVALDSFMVDPARFITGVLDRAMSSPELIHLLRLQDAFPRTCITRMLRGENGQPRPGLTKPPQETKDASTDMSVHAVEKFIDPSYHWNEWVLRRRALQLANLRKCSTKAQQTDESHFRRANDTQVYLPRVKATQSTRESGTKPPRQVQYFAGLRGTLDDCRTVSKYVSSKESEDKRPAVVTLSFEV